MIAGKGHDQRAHAERQPARIVQRSHASIDQWIPRLAVPPGHKFWIVLVRIDTQAIIGVVLVLVLQPTLCLEFLDEVTVPMEARYEAVD